MTSEGQGESEPVTPLNIVLLPDGETSRMAIEMSNTIAGAVEVHFTLDPKTRRPHLTLYQSSFPNRNISALTHTLRGISQTAESVEFLSLQRITVEFGTFVFWTANNSPQLAKLHETIVTKTNLLREGHIPAHLASVPLEPADAEDVKNYGLPMVLGRYWPHLTLTRIRNPEDATKIRQVVGDEKPATFKVKSISVCRLGDNGTISDTIEEFPLKASS